MVEGLQRAGVRCVFGLPGTQTIELFEALRQSKVRTVTATNELSAAFMAGGWARVTGDPGVLITISGPGFTWALTGIAEARLDSVPLIHIVGSPAPDPIPHRFRQQDLPLSEIARPLYKSIIDAEAFADLAEPIEEAMNCAKSGEPGPVLIQVSSMALQLRRALPALQHRGPGSENLPAFAAACARVARARRPIFLVGRGTIHHGPMLRHLIERIHAPVITTPSARGVISEDHPLNLGFRPFAGRLSEVNELLDSADVILAIGCKLGHSDTSGFELELPPERLIHFDASAEVIHANYPTSIGVVGDAGAVLGELLRSCKQQSEWTAAELAKWKRGLGPAQSDMVEPTIAGTRARTADSFFQTLRNVLPDDTMLALDSGLHQVLARRYYRVRSPHGLLIPTDLQSMGFAIPTAIGARLALPNRPVVALLGDGGFAMTALELLSGVREKLSLVVIVFVDGAFGQIRLQQLANYGTSHGAILNNPDFGLLAASIGSRFESVGLEDDIADAVRRALKHSGVTVIAVSVNDAFPIRRVAVMAMARSVARRTAGSRVLGFISRIFFKRNRTAALANQKTGKSS